MKFVYGIIALIVVIVAALFIVPAVMNWDSFKPDITERIEAATGRKLFIDGDIDVTLLPSPRLRVNDVRLANIEGATSADMARLKSLQLHLALGPLIGGDIEITSLTLVDPVIELERLGEGRANWQFEPASVEDPLASPAGDGEGDDDSGSGTGIRLDDVVLRNGTLIWRDHETGETEYLQRINADLSLGSRNGPFRGEGALTVRDVDATFAVTTGEIRPGRPLPVSLTVNLGDGLLGATVEGAVDDPRGTPRLRGGLSAAGDDIAALSAAFGVAESDTASGPARPFSLEGKVTASAQSMAVDDIRLALGDAQATGRLGWMSAGAPDAVQRVDAALRFRTLDLDAVLGKTAGAGAAAEGAADGVAAGDNENSDEGGAVDRPAPEFARAPTQAETAIGAALAALPGDVVANVEVVADAVRYRGGVVRQARAMLALEERVVTVEQARALMPGGADATLFGQLTGAPGGVAFDGQVELVADDLRTVMRWLGVDAGDVPADRLRRGGGNAVLALGPDRIAFRDVDVRVDASRLSGDIAIERASRPRLIARIALDRLNWNAYQPASGRAGAALAEDDAAPGGSDDPGAPAAPRSPASFAGLPEVDAEVALTVGSLTRGDLAYEGVDIEARLVDGTLSIDRAAVARAAGAALEMTGTVANIASALEVDLALTGEAESLAPVLRALDVETAVKPRSIGAVKFAGNAAGGEAGLTFSLETASSVGSIGLFGNVEQPFTAPVMVVGMQLRADDGGKLVDALGIAAPEAVRRLGALAIDAGLDGDLANLRVNLGAEAAGATLQVAGTLAGAVTDTPAYDLTADLAADDARPLLRALAGDNARDAAAQGELSMRARIQGDSSAAKIADFSASLGANSLSGNGDVVLGGTVPKVTARLSAGTFDLAALVGGAAAAAGAGDAAEGPHGGAGQSSASATSANGRQGAGEAERWSSAPMDLSVLNDFAADVGLQADALIVSGYRFENAAVDFAVADGLLDIHSLRGRIFDGQFEAEGRIADGAPPTAVISFKLAGADIAAALMQAGGIDAVTGRATIEGRLQTQGASEAELVRGLGGEVHLSGGDGVVRGVDIGHINAQLDQLDNAAAFISLARGGLSGGETPLHELFGTVVLQRGVAVTDDTRVLVEAGEGAVRGSADLPAWQLDLTALFHLTEQPKAPPIGVRLTGAIDRPARDYLTNDIEAFLVERFATRVIGRKVIPTLREGAKAEEGSLEDVLLRRVFGDPDEPTPEGPASGGEGTDTGDDGRAPSGPVPLDADSGVTADQPASPGEPEVRAPSEPVIRAPSEPVLRSPEGDGARSGGRSRKLDPQDLIRGILETLDD